MPQRRYYGGGYGQNEEYLQELGGPNYDPYSKRANIGLAIRNTINQIVAKRKEEQEKAKKEAQEKWAQTIEERKMAADELRARSYAENLARPEKEPTTPSEIQEAIIVQKSNPVKYPTVGHVLAEWHMKTPEKTAAQIEAESAARAKGAAPYRQPRETPQWKTPTYRQSQFIEVGVKKLENERNRLLRTGEKLDPTNKVNIPNINNIAFEIENIETAISKLNEHLGYIAQGNELSPREYAIAAGITSNIERVKREPKFWEPQTEIGGRIGQEIGGGILPPQVSGGNVQPSPLPSPGLPPEVQDYMKKHPELSVDEAMKLYQAWKVSQTKK